MARIGSGALTGSASAKINLTLHVIGRRADGYHLLDSLVAFAAVGDRLGAVAAQSLSLTLDGPFGAALGDAPDNLVLRAARALARAAGIAPGAALHLTKNLPVASGIGGGSADAAAALHLLRRLWTLDMDDRALAEIGLSLGADVPVCLFGRPAWLGGIGERIEPAPALPSCPAVLVNCGRPVATPAVFRARTGPFSAPDRFAEPPPDVVTLAAWLKTRCNDLTEPAMAVEPMIEDSLAALSAQPGCLLARLSGSGATCFGLFAAPAEAKAAAAAIAAARSGWWVVATTIG